MDQCNSEESKLKTELCTPKRAVWDEIVKSSVRKGRNSHGLR